MLETLAVLSQFVPRQKFILTPERIAAPGGADFSEALAARLARRLLPAVSPEGLVLYALHIPAMTGELHSLHLKAQMLSVHVCICSSLVH